jgi:hypothetical protein
MADAQRGVAAQAATQVVNCCTTAYVFAFGAGNNLDSGFRHHDGLNPDAFDLKY